MAAVCVQGDGYPDFSNPALACFGQMSEDNTRASTAQGSVSSEDPPVVQEQQTPATAANAATTAATAQQSPWNNQPAEPVSFWQGDGLGGGLSGEWPEGGMSLGFGNGSWSSGVPMPPPGPQGGIRGPNQPARPKRRFCTSFPEVQLCRRGTTCAFAHSREEIRAPLLSFEEELQDRAAMTDDFFMYKYKTMWCPIGVQHEWHTCVYAHNYQDARRMVSIGYGAKLCPYWSKKDTGAEYSQRCPLGLRCPYAHGAKEQLYHPHYFKTVICRDLRGKACPRQGLCAFFHNKAERRCVAVDDMDYSAPLPTEALPSEWVEEYLSPPFLPDASKGEDGMMDANGQSMGSYAAQGVQNSPYGMQQPIVFMLPYCMPDQYQQGSSQDQQQQLPQPTQSCQIAMGGPMNSVQMGPHAQMPGQMCNYVFFSPMDPSQDQQQQAAQT